MMRPARLVTVLTVAAALSACRSPYRNVASIAHTAEYQDGPLLERAWHLAAAATYAAHGVTYQSNMSFCGPASAVTVLESLGMTGIGLDHIFDHSSIGYWSVRTGGMTLDEMAELVRERSGRKTTVLRNLDVATFRRHLAEINRSDRRYIANFHRGPLFGHGGGHHSPLGAYLAERDLVLVLDVNASYKPWLVPAERLFAAIDTIDSSTGQKRGLVLVE